MHTIDWTTPIRRAASAVIIRQAIADHVSAADAGRVALLLSVSHGLLQGAPPETLPIEVALGMAGIPAEEAAGYLGAMAVEPPVAA